MTFSFSEQVHVWTETLIHRTRTIDCDGPFLRKPLNHSLIDRYDNTTELLVNNLLLIDEFKYDIIDDNIHAFARAAHLSLMVAIWRYIIMFDKEIPLCVIKGLLFKPINNTQEFVMYWLALLDKWKV